MENKTLTVLMSAYNSEHFISETIDSILNQTFKDFIFLIIDDCSTDNTLKIIKEYEEKDKRIEIIKNNINLGFTNSLNNGIKRIKSDYIARMDSDDICDPTRFEKQMNYMQKHNLDICGTNLIYFDDKGELGRKKYRDVKDTILIESPICHASTIIKREYFDKYGGYNPEYKVAQDYDLWLKFYSKGAKFGIVPEYLFFYRQHPQMAKASKTKLTLKNTIKIKLNAMKNYGIKFGFRGWLRLIAEMILYLLPSRVILFLFYLKNK